MKHFLAALAIFSCIFTSCETKVYCQESPTPPAPETDEGGGIEVQGLLSPNPQPIKPPPTLGEIIPKVSVTIDKSSIANHMRALQITISNQSEHTILVDADSATAGEFKSATLPQLEIAESPSQSIPAQIARDTRDTITAAVTVGAVQTIQGFHEQRQPVLKRYGVDEKRRENEIARFGKRLVWPGDSTQGIVYFATHSSLSGTSLEIPVSLPFGSNKNVSEKISTKVLQ